MSNTAIPTVPGTPFEGGFYVGRFRIGNDTFALIVSPQASGELPRGPWGAYGTNVPGTSSCCDGLANTLALAESGNAQAKEALALDIAGHTDWYLPSRDELELMYRALKPTAQESICSFRDGDNPSSLPAGYPYTESEPAQTEAEAFRKGGAEALEAGWYWSSTQCSAFTAWFQHFVDGGQFDYAKDYELRARAVRRFKA